MSTEVDEIKKRIDIVELIGQYLKLQKAGRNYKALCPFHSEKTPSFNVSPELQIFKCFGCQKGGDVFSFYQEIEGVDFPQAVKDLAQRTGVELKSSGFDARRNQQHQILLQINEASLKFFVYLLEKHPIGEQARQYLNQRQLKPETIKLFELGYAPNSWNSLGNYLLKKSFNLPEIISAGLVSPGKVKPGWYDRFRGRLIFPLRDQQGKLIGFAGRILKKDSQEAKYVNTPETPLFSKSHFLYGLHLSKVAIKTARQAVVVEGQFDLITPFQAGTTNIVASGGTAFTSQQLIMLKRYADEILIAFDADAAGNQASWRGIQLAKEQGLEVKVVSIGQGKDPDDFARSDPSGWKQAVTQAEPVYDFYFRSVTKNLDLNKAADKRQTGQKLLPIIANIPDHIEQDHYLKKLAQILNITDEVARQSLIQTKNKGAARATQNLIPDREQNTKHAKQEYLLSLLLLLPWEITKEGIKELEEADFSKEEAKTILTQLKQLEQENRSSLDLADLRAKLGERELSYFEKLALNPLPIEELEINKQRIELRKALGLVKRDYLQQQLHQISQNILQAERNLNSEQAEQERERAKSIKAKIVKYAKNQ